MLMALMSVTLQPTRAFHPENLWICWRSFAKPVEALAWPIAAAVPAVLLRRGITANDREAQAVWRPGFPTSCHGRRSKRPASD
jgi:hypothetical protein